ncbi:hypothetical protein TNCV_3377561 [Trichonephila clavipes]|nr:hypothetical protein TNCV_3377561 [Trichonephila clavipes]
MFVKDLLIPDYFCFFIPPPPPIHHIRVSTWKTVGIGKANRETYDRQSMFNPLMVMNESARNGVVLLNAGKRIQLRAQDFDRNGISSSEDDTSDEENFSSVRQWCKIDSSSPTPSRFSFTGDVVTI